MSQSVINIQNLSKSYLIGHQGPREKYTSLRDTLSRHATNFVRRSLDTVRGKQMLQGDSVEEFWALKDVSFDVREGEVLGIIGRNGAGKSTLLKVLSRITEPTKGRVQLSGRVASLLEVGTGFHPELTGRENITLNGAILGMSRREIKSKFDEIVEFAGVAKFLDTPVKRYSSGMYVRLAFSVAAHLEPEILIVDEVLAVGDSEFQKKCLGKLQNVTNQDGRTVIFVSHDMNAVSRLCSRAIVLEAGEISYIGETTNAVNHYKSNTLTPQTHWSRPKENTELPIQFTKIAILPPETSGKLECQITLQSRLDHLDAFIAIDLVDPAGNSIMQVIPSHVPYLKFSPHERNVSIIADIPPLVPGNYSLTFWIGPHNATTYDYVEQAIAFEIINSPCAERTFPHTPDHGYIVANSEFKLIN